MSARPTGAEQRTVAPPGRRRAIVAARREHGAYIVLEVDDPEGPRPRPGQFHMVAATERWGGGEDERPFLPRAFSVLRAPAPGRLEFLLEVVGPGTARLAELSSGDGLWLLGPLGAGFTPPPDGGGALLVGGGVGIAPLAIWQDELLARGERAPALAGFRDAAHAAGATLLQEAEVATDDGSEGHRGTVAELLSRRLGEPDGATVYACGPPRMLEAVRALCAEREVPAQLAMESGMACGFGACFGCVVPTRTGYVRLCVEGPVLDAALLDTALAPGEGR